MVHVQDMGLTSKARSTFGEQKEAETLKQDSWGEGKQCLVFFSRAKIKVSDNTESNRKVQINRKITQFLKQEKKKM